MRRVALLVLAAITVVGVSILVAAQTGDSGSGPVRTAEARRATTTSSSTTTTTTLPVPSSDGDLQLLRTVTGDISPKSVVASGRGQVFAQNMMYKHTITVYDRSGNLVKTIPDTVDLATFGVGGHPGTSRGAPVEVAFSPDGTKAYISNYSMYGAGFGPEGSDECHPSDGYDRSFVYRVDVKTLTIDHVIEVGAVPKYVAATPDGKYVIVTNWCTFDASIIDVATLTEVERIPLGPYPRGIVVTPDSRTAYIAVMGTQNIARLDLTNLTTSWIYGVGSGPRHLVLSPDGTTLYATLNGEGRVAKLDAARGIVEAKVTTGQAPRSMAISTDGKSLYVVNYESGTMSKVDAATMRTVQTVKTGFHPIGITYDRQTGDVWVANYTGSIMIFGTGPNP
ncbi:MAG: YncE family protein [Acidimicrobiia bacterium]